MKKVKMTYDDYDKYIDVCEKMTFRCGSWLPKVEDIQYYAEKLNAKHFIEFLIWILETYSGEKDEEYKKVQSCINSILYENLCFVD